MFNYKTHGTCSKEIKFDVENNIVKNVEFIGGCDGNLKGIANLVSGMNIDEAIEKLDGIDCRGRGTSCPDQLSHALKEWKSNN